MRISDWSSDVCSSDLLLADGDGERRFAGDLACKLHHRRVKFGGGHSAVDEADFGSAGCVDHLAGQQHLHCVLDRKSVVEGKSVSGRVDLGGGRIIKKKNQYE